MNNAHNYLSTASTVPFGPSIFSIHRAGCITYSKLRIRIDHSNKHVFSQVLGTEFREQQIDGECLADAGPDDFEAKVRAKQQ